MLRWLAGGRGRWADRRTRDGTRGGCCRGSHLRTWRWLRASQEKLGEGSVRYLASTSVEARTLIVPTRGKDSRISPPSSWRPRLHIELGSLNEPVIQDIDG